jgi:hypothetical protein
MELVQKNDSVLAEATKTGQGGDGGGPQVPGGS